MVNMALPKRFGIAGKQLIGQNLNVLLPHELVEQREIYFAQAVRKKEPITFEIMRDGNIFLPYLIQEEM